LYSIDALAVLIPPAGYVVQGVAAGGERPAGEDQRAQSRRSAEAARFGGFQADGLPVSAERRRDVGPVARRCPQQAAERHDPRSLPGAGPVDEGDAAVGLADRVARHAVRVYQCVRQVGAGVGGCEGGGEVVVPGSAARGHPVPRVVQQGPCGG
jgi:hypothetical protein